VSNKWYLDDGGIISVNMLMEESPNWVLKPIQM